MSDETQTPQEQSSGTRLPAWANERADGSTYRPSTVRQLIQQAGGDPVTALENYIAQNEQRYNELQAQSKADYERVRNENKTLREKYEEAEKTREQVRQEAEALRQAQRQTSTAQALKDKFGDDHLMYEAAMKREGYDIDVDNGSIVLKNGDETTPLDAALNDDFYARYPRLKPQEAQAPAGDEPLRGLPGEPKSENPASAMAAYKAQMERRKRPEAN